MTNRTLTILVLAVLSQLVTAQTRDDIPRRVWVGVSEGLPPQLATLTAEMLQSRYRVVITPNREEAHTTLEYFSVPGAGWECRVAPYKTTAYTVSVSAAPLLRQQIQVIERVVQAVEKDMSPVQPEIQDITIDLDERTRALLDSAQRARLWYSKNEISAGVSFFTAEFTKPVNATSVEGVSWRPGLQPKSADLIVTLTDGSGGWRHGLFSRWGDDSTIKIPDSVPDSSSYQDYGYSFGRLWRVGPGPVWDFYLDARIGASHYTTSITQKEGWFPTMIATVGFGIGWDILPFLTLNASIQAETGLLTLLTSGGIFRENQLIKVNVPVSIGWRPGF